MATCEIFLPDTSVFSRSTKVGHLHIEKRDDARINPRIYWVYKTR